MIILYLLLCLQSLLYQLVHVIFLYKKKHRFDQMSLSLLPRIGSKSSTKFSALDQSVMSNK